MIYPKRKVCGHATIKIPSFRWFENVRGRRMIPVGSALNPQRVIADLKELRRLTGDTNGAQRVAFTPPGPRQGSF